MPIISCGYRSSLLKGSTSRRLREQFPRLKKVCGREQLWTQAYYVGTCGWCVGRGDSAIYTEVPGPIGALIPIP
ncbi:transposase [Acidiferrobacter sp.]|uniref:transposase n=1 Tax=Acidiferrobacter sp. TaxID=1872107 RepID=UPI00344C91CB